MKTGYTYLGIPIYINPDLDPKPKMTLSEAVPVTPEFRAEINAWMAKFFGWTEGRVVRLEKPYPTVFMGPETLRQLQQKLQLHGMWEAA